MNWIKLVLAVLPIVEEIIKAVGDASAAGKSPDAMHNTVVDHTAQLPAKIRG